MPFVPGVCFPATVSVADFFDCVTRLLKVLLQRGKGGNVRGGGAGGGGTKKLLPSRKLVFFSVEFFSLTVLFQEVPK